MTQSVNLIHPQSLCEFDYPASTVNTVFNKKTPYSAHLVRSPCFGV